MAFLVEAWAEVARMAYWVSVVFLAVAMMVGERRPGWGRIPHGAYTWAAVMFMLVYLSRK